MKVCPYCHSDLPDDATFCSYCGKPIDKKKKIREEKKENVSRLKKNPRENNWAKLGLLLFFIGLIICDFFLGTLFNAMSEGSIFIFYVSLVLYAISIICGILSLYIDYKDQKNGYEPNGNKSFAIVCIVMSIYISLVNLTQVIL